MSINKEDKRVQGWDITRIRDWDEVKKKKKLYIYIYLLKKKLKRNIHDMGGKLGPRARK